MLAIKKLLFCNIKALRLIPTAGLKHFEIPPNYDDVEFAGDKPKLRFTDKVPQYPPNMRPPKMQKRLRLMRGPAADHLCNLQHKQYGIQALGGGRMRWGHFEMVRLGIGRKMDISRMFAIWRIDPVWQPVTRRGQGQRLGGGKGAIDHYATPIQSGRIIVELGGKCEFEEVKKFLQGFADLLPFPARAVSHELLQKEKEVELAREKANTNPYTLKYLIQNNFGGCHKFLRPIDHKLFGKYE